MRDAGILDIAERLSPGQASKFEEAILSGIRWFSRAQQESDLGHELASLVIGLETIVQSPGDEFRLSPWVSEGVPLILKTDLESRERLQERIRKWYKHRSGLVHGGSGSLTKELAEYGGMDEARDTVHKLLLWAIANRGRFRTTQDVQTWLTRRRLSAE